jgi:hypothetical protein
LPVTCAIAPADHAMIGRVAIRRDVEEARALALRIDGAQ